MGAPEAVGSVAVARSEVRKSLDRLDYHLARGTRGAKGVRREVAYLDALHRQTVRLSGRAVGAAYTGRPLESFGQKAAQGLATDGRGRSRMKSSILADFSSDGLQPTRDWTSRTNDLWIWTANASACPTCLAKHGKSGRGQFVPSHPSCLCIPTPFLDARDQLVRPLSQDEFIATAREYGNPRYYKKLDDLENGLLSFDEIAQVENVNAQARGLAKFRQHLAKGEVRQTALPGTGAPAPTATPATATPQPPTPKPKPKPKAEPKPKQPPKPEPGAKADYSDFGPHSSVDEQRVYLKKLVDDLWDGKITEAVYDDAVKAAKAQYRAYQDFIEEVAKLDKADELAKVASKIDLSKPPRTASDWTKLIKKGEATFDDMPDIATIRNEWEVYINAKRAQRLGKATNAERIADIKKMSSFSDDIADDLAGVRAKYKKIEIIEEQAQKRWPLTEDGIETYFDFKGMDPELVLNSLDDLFKLAGEFPVPAERLRYVGGLTNLEKMYAAKLDEVYPYKMGRMIRNGITGKGKGTYWSGKSSRTNGWVIDGRTGSIASQRPTMMGLNPSKYKTLDGYMDMRRSNVEMGWYPPNTAKSSATAVHEFSHLIDYWMDDIAALRAGSIVDGADSMSLSNLLFRLRDKYTSPVSQYAKRNKREEWAEYLSAKVLRGETNDAEWNTWSRFWKLWDDDSLKAYDKAELRGRYQVPDDEWEEFLKAREAWDERLQREFPEAFPPE